MGNVTDNMDPAIIAQAQPWSGCSVMNRSPSIVAHKLEHKFIFSS